MSEYIPPEFELSAFNCPNCSVYAQQIWQRVQTSPYIGSGLPMRNLNEPILSYCAHCRTDAIWLNERLLYPDDSGVAPPNSDMDHDIQNDYREAASVLNKSPRAAAALLRLAVQKLCRQLGQSGRNINNDIAELVKDGLPDTIQQSLDSVRVIGNESVHPGTMDLTDAIDTGRSLFRLVNFIAQRMLTEPREAREIFELLPEKKRGEIAKRDSASP